MARIIVLQYVTASGRRPFQDWIDSIKVKAIKASVAARIGRVRAGTFGDWRSVGDGVFELRVDRGPGYRIYLARQEPTLVILLAGGEKKSQQIDINRAKAYWKDYEARSKARTERHSI